MGTRADFYVGKGNSAEWIGSIAWDGYRDGINDTILHAHSEAEFRSAVKAFFGTRDDATRPADGWPWPWETSATTDCSYWFFDGRCWDEHDDRYAPCDEPQPYNRKGDPIKSKFAKFERIDFHDMYALMNVTFGKRSGLIVIAS